MGHFLPNTDTPYWRPIHERQHCRLRCIAACDAYDDVGSTKSAQKLMMCHVREIPRGERGRRSDDATPPTNGVAAAFGIMVLMVKMSRQEITRGGMVISANSQMARKGKCCNEKEDGDKAFSRSKTIF